MIWVHNVTFTSCGCFHFNSSMFQLTRNLTLLGPPGSGKGFYGRVLASHWNVPVVTASAVLREHAGATSRMRDMLNSGKLVDCQSVSYAILEYMARRHSGQHYVFDGFPRTPLQIELMERDWPTDYQIRTAMLLDIPDEVCAQKMLGRRNCRRCGHSVNVADVQCLGFDLPPVYPDECVKDQCEPAKDWSARDDDRSDVIAERLRVHRQHEGPIVDYYARRGTLLKVTPYSGIPDIPWMQHKVEQWITSLDLSNASP